jgi:altronate dehydratase small subunit
MKGTVIDAAALVLDERDNVATLLEDCEAGRTFEAGDGTVKLSTAIAFGHKFALGRIERSQPVYKYGEVIGRATEDVEPGDWVHTHNCRSNRGRGDRVVQDGERA